MPTLLLPALTAASGRRAPRPWEALVASPVKRASTAREEPLLARAAREEPKATELEERALVFSALPESTVLPQLQRAATVPLASTLSKVPHPARHVFLDRLPSLPARRAALSAISESPVAPALLRASIVLWESTKTL